MGDCEGRFCGGGGRSTNARMQFPSADRLLLIVLASESWSTVRDTDGCMKLLDILSLPARSARLSFAVCKDAAQGVYEPEVPEEACRVWLGCGFENERRTRPRGAIPHRLRHRDYHHGVAAAADDIDLGGRCGPVRKTCCVRMYVRC